MQRLFSGCGACPGLHDGSMLMGELDICFPHLGIYLRDIPYGFTVFGFFIAFYAVIIACGMLLAVAVCETIGSREGFPKDFFWDIAFWLIPVGIAGARLYYVIFSWENYAGEPLQILNLRQGGLAIYGGVIAGFATVAVYTKKKQLSFPKVMDVIMNGLLIGQIMGRWGNFTNREAFGGYTDNLFAMRIPQAAVRNAEMISADITAHIPEGADYIQVHPTFLYESFWNLCLLAFILWYRKRKRFDGEIVLLYLGGYGFGRFLIEGLRTDQLLIPGTDIAVSQMLGLFLTVFSVVAAIAVRKKKTAQSRKPSGGEGETEHT